MPNPSDKELADLFRRGTDLCSRWEELAELQLAALEVHDLASLALINTGQLRLAQEFYNLQMALQETVELLRAGLATEGEGTEPRWPAALRELRQTFQTAVDRVLGTNYRNSKAFATLLLLSAACESALAPRQALIYDRRGTLASGGSPIVRSLDCEG